MHITSLCTMERALMPLPILAFSFVVFLSLGTSATYGVGEVPRMEDDDKVYTTQYSDPLGRFPSSRGGFQDKAHAKKVPNFGKERGGDEHGGIHGKGPDGEKYGHGGPTIGKGPGGGGDGDGDGDGYSPSPSMGKGHDGGYGYGGGGPIGDAKFLGWPVIGPLGGVPWPYIGPLGGVPGISGNVPLFPFPGWNGFPPPFWGLGGLPFPNGIFGHPFGLPGGGFPGGNKGLPGGGLPGYTTITGSKGKDEFGEVPKVIGNRN